MGAGNFSEKEILKAGGWKQLFGDYESEGVSVVWHDFSAPRVWEWGKRFHRESLEICVNFEGGGVYGESRGNLAEAGPRSVSYYHGAMRGRREREQRHCFLTIEMSRDWLAKLLGNAKSLCPADVRAFLNGSPRTTGLPKSRRMTTWVRRAAEEMLRPPVSTHGIWFPAKILEISAHVFAPEQMFCERQKQVARERVEKVKEILARDLEFPPGLAELAKEVGCSPFHLSRLFSDETGTTITRHLRTIRLERAAELLLSGKHNVTEAAMMVGYSSLSHFSKAFAGQFGHCPCVFPLQKKS